MSCVYNDGERAGERRVCTVLGHVQQNPLKRRIDVPLRQLDADLRPQDGELEDPQARRLDPQGHAPGMEQLVAEDVQRVQDWDADEMVRAQERFYAQFIGN